MKAPDTELQRAKAVVLEYYDNFDGVAGDRDQMLAVLNRFAESDYAWRGLHPFHELRGTAPVVDTFWMPLTGAMKHVQRRQDIFMAGYNDVDAGQSCWVCSMGHLVGLFDEPWLGIPPTRRMAFFRYAEFHRVAGGKIAESAVFFDLLSMMKQAGCYPLAPQTGANFVHPGPRTHDGLMWDPQEPNEAVVTMDLINRMVADLSELNRSDDGECPPELLARSWHDDMVWYGPAGIGSSFTIKRYQEQHQFPFRKGLKDKRFNGHVCRFAEGCYGGFFGWPNLTNTPAGGFLGLPASDTPGDMRVVDVYRREGDRLAENWVFIDLPHYLNMQGVDVLAGFDAQSR